MKRIIKSMEGFVSPLKFSKSGNVFLPKLCYDECVATKNIQEGKCGISEHHSKKS